MARSPHLWSVGERAHCRRLSDSTISLIVVLDKPEASSVLNDIRIYLYERLLGHPDLVRTCSPIKLPPILLNLQRSLTNRMRAQRAGINDSQGDSNERALVPETQNRVSQLEGGGCFFYVHLVEVDVWRVES
jgi:hypothetical protein